jgi:hypothetical protein
MDKKETNIHDFIGKKLENLTIRDIDHISLDFKNKHISVIAESDPDNKPYIVFILHDDSHKKEDLYMRVKPRDQE